jgi:hypothetical protein
MNCGCSVWIRGLAIPTKIIIFKCSQCGTSYTLYPNGQIQFETSGAEPSAERKHDA